MDAQSGFTKDI